jgi:lactate dehydrogenase-like 2-hydroxyacid dehydrogenase
MLSRMPTILQVSPLGPELESRLREKFAVHRWFESEDQHGWLKSQGGEVMVAVTSATVGIATALMRSLPNLKMIAIFGVGFDAVDLDAARALGIRVTNTPDVLTDDVADLALALTLSLLRDLPRADRYVKEGEWPKRHFPLGRKASGRHFGIVGLGRIGKAIAGRLSPIGTVAYTGTVRQAVPFAYFASAVELAHASSVLILAASAHAGNERLIGRPVFDALGPEGYIVNIARGSLIDDAELISALVERRIAGAALDVFTDEPRVPQALRELPNVILTPHIGSATRETRTAMAELVMVNVNAFLSGAPLPSALT